MVNAKICMIIERSADEKYGIFELRTIILNRNCDLLMFINVTKTLCLLRLQYSFILRILFK